MRKEARNSKALFYGCKMEQLSIYLFESKSIQAYLSRTGKLRHMINASNRLDALIGPDRNGLIYQSLSAAGLDPETDSNLLASQKAGYEVAEDDGRIVFFRYLGGSLSCYALGETGYEKLLRFRSALTLSVHASLPGLQFSDAFVSREISGKDEFYSLLGDAYEQLAADNNRPTMLLPLATACTASAPATGEAAVRSQNKSVMKIDRDSQDRVMESLKANYKDIKLSLYEKYLMHRGETDQDLMYLAEKLNEIFVRYANLTESDDSLEPEGDIALIHMDGNSVGATLIKLRDILKKSRVSRPEYVKVMLEISAILGDSTRNAVVTAVSRLLKKNESLLKFRPLVLGGDDVTLLIQPDCAADFCVEFAREFKTETEKNLKGSPLIMSYLNNPDTEKPYLTWLTTSGGILFQKKKHPYATSVKLVEGLAEIAKNRFPHSDRKDIIAVNPSAVAFVRLTESSGEDIKTIVERLRSFRQPASGAVFHTGSRNGFITCNNSGESLDEIPLDEITLEGLVSAVRDQKGGPVITRFRRMLSEISRGRLADAERLFSQADTMDTAFKKSPVVSLLIKKALREEGNCKNPWYTQTDDGMETVINDILVLDHYINGDDSADGRDESDGAASEKEA